MGKHTKSAGDQILFSLTINIGQNTHHNKRQHYIKRDLRQQHSKAATQHDNIMVATQHGTNIIGHRQQHKGQEGRDHNTSHKATSTVSKSGCD